MRPVSKTAPVIELRQVTKQYATVPPVHALQEVDLTIGHGEFVAIVGPSGSGKSTLLSVMGTLDQPTSGTVRFAGDDISNLPDRDLSGLRAWRLGFVFQQFFLLDGFGVVDNVSAGLLYRGLSRAEQRSVAMRAVERVGLGHRVDHKPNQLSGGEQQRVAIARAIAGSPALLLADEPTGNLDSVTGQPILDLLKDLHRSGGTIVVITHDHDVAAQCERVVEIRGGKLVTPTRTLAR